MSASFDKETTASTAKSLIGALMALGAGFIFMFLGLVAVSANSQQANDSHPARVLQQALQSDLLTYQRGSLSVSKDQTVLKFRNQPAGKPAEEVTYKVAPNSGEVSRVRGGESQKMAKLADIRFESSAGLLLLHWKGAVGTHKTSWALNRWPKGSRA